VCGVWCVCGVCVSVVCVWCVCVSVCVWVCRQFVIPDAYENYKTSQTRLISLLLGHEGRGSLFVYLKKKRLVDIFGRRKFPSVESPFLFWNRNENDRRRRKTY